MSTLYIRYPAPGGGGVTSINTETGDVTLVAGPGITITPSGQNITITNTEAAAPISIGPLDSQAENSNGLAIVSNVLSTQSADATHPGMVNNTSQTFSGNKTFTGSISAANLSGTNSGDVTLGTASGLSLSGQALSLALSSTSTTGSLSSTDWNTFNGKQASGSYITALTGDGTASGPGSAALTLATVNSNVGSFGSATQVPSITVNAKGLTTAASNVSIQIAESQVTNLVSDLAGKQAGPLTGDVTTSGAAATLATVNSNVGSFTYSNITVNAKGLVTAASSGAAPVTTLAAVGTSPNANAGTISGNTLNLQPFNSTNPGVVTASGGGTTNFLRADGTWVAPGGGGSSIKIAYVSDQKSAGTNGGTFTSGSWQTRDLNTLSDPQSIGVTVSSNQFTLPAGTYDIEASAPAYLVNYHKAVLFDVTGSAIIITGSTEYCPTSPGNIATTHSFIQGQVTVSSSNTYQIQHQCSITESSDGFGVTSTGFGVNETYTQVKITKIA